MLRAQRDVDGRCTSVCISLSMRAINNICPSLSFGGLLTSISVSPSLSLFSSLLSRSPCSSPSPSPPPPSLSTSVLTLPHVTPTQLIWSHLTCNDMCLFYPSILAARCSSPTCTTPSWNEFHFSLRPLRLPHARAHETHYMSLSIFGVWARACRPYPWSAISRCPVLASSLCCVQVLALSGDSFPPCSQRHHVCLGNPAGAPHVLPGLQPYNEFNNDLAADQNQNSVPKALTHGTLNRALVLPHCRLAQSPILHRPESFSRARRRG